MFSPVATTRPTFTWRLDVLLNLERINGIRTKIVCILDEHLMLFLGSVSQSYLLVILVNFQGIMQLIAFDESYLMIHKFTFQSLEKS